jgi:ATP-dependent protease ClpP protease subunit
MSDPETHDDQPEFIKVEGSDIFFYCDVCEESVAELIRAVKKLELEMRVSLTKIGLHTQMPRVTIHIRSDGGDLYAGLAAMDFLQNADVHVTTVGEGCVASAATLIFLGGDVRLIRRHAYVLIHQIGSDLWGKYEDLKAEMVQNDRIMRNMKKIYMRETSLPEHKLAKMLKRDVYLSYRKCVKYGVVTVA